MLFISAGYYFVIIIQIFGSSIISLNVSYLILHCINAQGEHGEWVL